MRTTLMALMLALAAAPALAQQALDPIDETVEQAAELRKGYILFRSAVTDDDAMRAYGRAAWPVIAAHGGRFLVLSDAGAVLEGEVDPRRLAILEFPSLTAARTFWDSREYQEIKQMRAGAGAVQAILVEGLVIGSTYNP